MGFIYAFLVIVTIYLVIKWQLYKNREKESVETEKRIAIFLEEQRKSMEGYIWH